MVLRRATADDTALLAALGARTFTEAFMGVHDPGRVARYAARSFAEPRIAEQLAQPGAAFLLGVDPTTARVVAYAHVRPAPATMVPAERPVELARLYVELPLTGRGIGSRMMAAVLAHARARAHDRIWLGVWEHNRAAQRFYRRWGFVPVGQIAFVLDDEVQTDHVLSRPVG
ncbi:GNAT family N-acetyltransferase [Egicoccus sp. AB-alg2]|uniref:GNAT family N-acetyltransferase n=1 Tax=Egicoccus sp. AB-alg2 TaxID=3242693 RepID=UPI00359DCD51